jgi:hypothetical protein
MSSKLKFFNKNNLGLHFFVAFLMRFLFTLFGIYHDSILIRIENHIINIADKPKYTDVDYSVFTDAAYYVHRVNYLNTKKNNLSWFILGYFGLFW